MRSYKRIILKLSGEALKGPLHAGVHPETIQKIAIKIKAAKFLGVQIAIVIGGGNIFRGLAASEKGMDRTTADNMGMLATVINALALQTALEQVDVDTRVQSAIPMQRIAEPVIIRRAIRHLEKNRLVIFAAGTGNPYFSTDTTAALRASELDADAIFKATKVDGVYSADPQTDAMAIRYEQLVYQEALEKRLKIMDSTAFSMCMDNNIPIIVFNFFQDQNRLINILKGDLSSTTLVRN